jgi:DHA2 family multidrug resistance protein
MIVCLGIAAVIGLVVFCVRALRSKDPILDLHVFRHRTFSIGVFLTTALGFVLFGSLVLLPIMLQTLFGYPSLQAGIAMAPRGIGSFIAMPIVGLLTQRFDGRKLVAIGLAVGGGTLIWLGQINLQAGYWNFFWPQLFQGAALGLLFVPLTTVTMGELPREEIGNASTLFNLVRNIGGSIGIAITASALTRIRVAHVVALGTHVSAYDPNVASMMSNMQRTFELRAPGTPSDMGALAAMNGMIQRQAAMLSFIDMFRILGLIFVLLVPLVFLMHRPPRRTGGEPAPAVAAE